MQIRVFVVVYVCTVCVCGGESGMCWGVCVGVWVVMWGCRGCGCVCGVCVCVVVAVVFVVNRYWGIGIG